VIRACVKYDIVGSVLVPFRNDVDHLASTFRNQKRSFPPLPPLRFTMLAV
jgi:hypothetical protein